MSCTIVFYRPLGNRFCQSIVLVCERLGQAGLRRAGQFTWQQTAEQTMGAYRQALAGLSKSKSVTLS